MIRRACACRRGKTGEARHLLIYILLIIHIHITDTRQQIMIRRATRAWHPPRRGNAVRPGGRRYWEEKEGWRKKGQWGVGGARTPSHTREEPQALRFYLGFLVLFLFFLCVGSRPHFIFFIFWVWLHAPLMLYVGPSGCTRWALSLTLKEDVWVCVCVRVAERKSEREIERERKMECVWESADQ
jgi:hypothetical protein